MLVAIAIANVILWSGVIAGLLLYLARDAQQVEEQVDRLEAQLAGREEELPAGS